MGFHFLVTFSAGYEMANDYVLKNAAINARIGSVSSSSLAPFGFNIKDAGNNGTGLYEIKVNGEHGQGRAFISARKQDGHWTIEKAHFVVSDGSVVILKE